MILNENLRSLNLRTTLYQFTNKYTIRKSETTTTKKTICVKAKFVICTSDINLDFSVSIPCWGVL